MADERYAEIIRIEFYQNLTHDLKLYMEKSIQWPYEK
jgi:hypothetical protein